MNKFEIFSKKNIVLMLLKILQRKNMLLLLKAGYFRRA